MEDSDISLITVMAYNDGFILNLKNVFDSLNVEIIRDPPRKKKGKEIDVKNIKVKKGTIISAKWGKFIKGIDKKPLGKYKFYLEIDGQPKEYIDTYDNINKYYDMVEKNGKFIMMEKLEEKLCVKCNIHPAKFGKSTSTKPTICRYCTEEMAGKLEDKGKIHQLVEVTQKKLFPHQISVDYAYKDGMNINMFLFMKNIKIAGFRYEKHCIRMIKRFWKHHLVNSTNDSVSYFHSEDSNPGYRFETTMTNSSFETQYNFMLTKANTLINQLQKDDDSILECDFEPTIDTGVTIRLKAIKPDDYNYNKITWLKDEQRWEDSIVFEIPDRNKSVEDEKRTTISLYRERFMISTRYDVLLKQASDFIYNFMEENKKQLEVEKKDIIEKFELNVF